MKKRAKISRFSWSRRETIILVVSVIVVAIWGFFYSFAVEKYGHQYAISLTAMLVASIAAIGTLLSLQWTRNTIRPFLSFDGTIKLGGSDREKTLAFLISNTGSMPANDVRIRVDVFGIDESINLNNLSNRYEGFFDTEEENTKEEMVLFPNQNWHTVYNANLTRSKDKALWEGLLSSKVKLRITIWYSSFGRKHKTVQTLAFDELSLSSDGKHFHGISIEPQKWV